MKFDSTNSQSFNNDTARNFIIFDVENSSSSHADNRKNNFLVLSEVPTPGINGCFDSLGKNLELISVKLAQNFA